MNSNNIFNRFKKNFSRYGVSSVTVGFSGGPDSVFLVEMLSKMNIDIEAAYFNTLYRDESSLEEQFIVNFCKERKISLHIQRENIKKLSKERKMNIKECSRAMRYGFFESLKGTVVTAHNLDDNVETFLFRLLRGSSIRGLKGIPEMRDKYIRPMLSFSKREIVEYLDSNNIKYFTDSSNALNIFTRNKIRNTIFPLFEEINPNFREKISNFISDLNDIAINLKNHENDLDIDNRKYLQTDLLKKVLSIPNITRNKIRAIERLKHIEGSATIDLSKNLVAKNRYGKISIEEREHNYTKNLQEEKQKESKKIELEKVSKEELKENKEKERTKDKRKNKRKNIKDIKLKIGEKNLFFGQEITAEFVDELGELTSKNLYVNFNLLNSDLRIRSRLDGDRFNPLGMDGSKRIKNLFIDLKIDRFSRDFVPIVVDGEKIVWIAGIRGDRYYAARVGDKKILKLSIS